MFRWRRPYVDPMAYLVQVTGLLVLGFWGYHLPVAELDSFARVFFVGLLYPLLGVMGLLMGRAGIYTNHDEVRIQGFLSRDVLSWEEIAEVVDRPYGHLGREIGFRRRDGVTVWSEVHKVRPWRLLTARDWLWPVLPRRTYDRLLVRLRAQHAAATGVSRE